MKLMLWMLLLVPLVSGQYEYDNAQSLLISLNISSSLEILPQSTSSNIDYVTASLYFHPVTDKRLNILNLLTNPEAMQIDDRLEYTWKNPIPSMIQYSVFSVVKTLPTNERVDAYVQFPVITQKLPSETRRYLAKTRFIDFDNPNIVSLANQIVGDEDDLYVVINNLAVWVHDNIYYNLSSSNLAASIKASEVLADRTGVCDELTNLFIAFVRSLGVPARFISGIAYTESDQFSTAWGPHGWAEVYFPGKGWVPFDPTFGQYGWVDATHIKLKESQDASEPSTRVEWKGVDVDVSLIPLDFSVVVLSKAPAIPASLVITAEPVYDRVGVGSYNQVRVSVENLRSYYQSTTLRLANTQGVSVIGGNEYSVSLKPKEKKIVFFTFRVDDSLNPGYDYSFPILVINERNANATTVFGASRNNPVYDSSDFTEQGVPIEDIFSCSARPYVVVVPDPVLVECVIHNVKSPGTLCVGSVCKPVIGKSSQRNRITITDTLPGEKTVVAMFTDSVSTSKKILRYIIADQPSLVLNISAPEYVRYDEYVYIQVGITQTSMSTPQDVVIAIISKMLNKTYVVSDFVGNNHVTIMIPASDLGLVINNLTIAAYWNNEKGDLKKVVYNKSVSLVDITFFQSIKIALRAMVFFVISYL